MTADEPTDDRAVALDSVKRADTLRRLARSPTSREELEVELGVSKATLHRIVHGFVDHGFVRETDDGVTLTGAGRVAATAVDGFLDRMAAVRRLGPLLNGLPASIDFPLGAFADAEVVTPTDAHPQRPVQRVVDFVTDATILRATGAVLLPIYVEVLSREIQAGMETELVLTGEVVRTLRSEYPDRLGDALDRGTLSVYVTDAVDVGLALAEEHALVVGSEGGVVQLVAVTDDPAAIAWTEAVYDRYRELGMPMAR